MVGPGGGATAAHFEDVGHHGEHRGVRVGADVVEETKSSDVESSLNR